MTKNGFFVEDHVALTNRSASETPGLTTGNDTSGKLRLSMLNDEDLLTPADVAEILQVKVNTLAIWRTKRCNFWAHTKVGKLVRYYVSDLRVYLNSGVNGRLGRSNIH